MPIAMRDKNERTYRERQGKSPAAMACPVVQKENVVLVELESESGEYT